MKLKINRILSLVFLLSSLVLQGYSQCSVFEIPFAERVNSSSIIIEGRVKAISSYWNKDKTMIYSSNKIEIFKILKGHLSETEINIITKGGIVGQQMIKATNLLTLKANEVGIFMLKAVSDDKINSDTAKDLNYEAFSSKQGFIRYSETDAMVSDLFQNYGSMNQVYKDIFKFTGQKAREIKPFDYSKVEKIGRAAPVISEFFPDTISAGTKSILTIRGKSFGTNATVKFSNADDGGKTKIEPLEQQYISRSDNEIIVEVPENAGTGKFQVVNGTTGTSLKTLQVSYAYSNVPQSDYQGRFINQSGGGYSWQMHPDFEINADAKAAFLRAFTKWRCSSLVTWTLGDNTPTDKIEKDNVNVIRFDKNSELPEGVLGICYSYYSTCEKGKWFVSELDIVFDDQANWNFSTTTSIGTRFDLETIALHELGHGHQLGHVINSKDLMHFSITAGLVKRELNTNNLACAALVISNSSQSGICNFRPMTLLTPDVCNEIGFGYFDFDGISAYPNPFVSETQISYQIASETNVQAALFDVFGNKMYTLVDEIQKPGRHVYNLNGLQYDMSSGIYVFALYLNGTLKTKKILKTIN